MKTVLELRTMRKNLIEKMRPLAEKHSLNNDERIQWEKGKKEIEDIDREYTYALEDLEVKRFMAAGRQNDRDLSRYSLRRAIELRMQRKKLDGVELEMHQEAEKENRELGLEAINPMAIGVPSLLRYAPLKRASTGQNVTTAGDGGNLKQEEPVLFIEGLRNAIVLPRMGARYMTGLVGDFPISIGGTFSSTWMAEYSSASTTKMTFGKKSLTPKRLQTQGVLSRRLILQSSLDAEALIEGEIIDAIAQAIQTAAINGSGADSQPTGLLQTEGIGSVPGGTNGAAPEADHLIALETAVATGNALLKAEYQAFLTNALVRGKLRKTFNNETYGDRPLWERGPLPGVGEVLSYPAWVTNAVPSNLTKGSASGICSAIIFGQWDQMFIGQWGGFEVIIDPYSLSDLAEVKITVVSHADTGLGHPESFAAMVDALTT
jgi:HK97 family phage major capsid protein